MPDRKETGMHQIKKYIFKLSNYGSSIEFSRRFWVLLHLPLLVWSQTTCNDADLHSNECCIALAWNYLNPKITFAPDSIKMWDPVCHFLRYEAFHDRRLGPSLKDYLSSVISVYLFNVGLSYQTFMFVSCHDDRLPIDNKTVTTPLYCTRLDCLQKRYCGISCFFFMRNIYITQKVWKSSETNIRYCNIWRNKLKSLLRKTCEISEIAKYVEEMGGTMFIRKTYNLWV